MYYWNDAATKNTCVLYDVCSDLTFQIHTISDSYWWQQSDKTDRTKVYFLTYSAIVRFP